MIYIHVLIINTSFLHLFLVLGDFLVFVGLLKGFLLDSLSPFSVESDSFFLVLYKLKLSLISLNLKKYLSEAILLEFFTIVTKHMI